MRTQLAVSALAGYATWLAVKCPCERTLSCHLKPFFLSLGALAKNRAIQQTGLAESTSATAGNCV